jgi:hypothetical protein
MSVQTTNSSSSSSSSTSNTSSSSSTTSKTITTDFDIFGVGDEINTSNYVYDGQTTLLVNSSSSQGSTTVLGTYFNPSESNTFNWNLTSNSNLSCSAATNALLNIDYTTMQNIIPIGSSIPQYNIDLLNTGNTTVDTNNSSFNTVTMALLSNTYTTTGGLFKDNKTPTNTQPNYPSNSNCSSYLFTGNYYFPQTSDIVIVYMIYTINGTDLTAYESAGTSPTVSVMIYNRVISRDDLSKGNSVGKLYTAGPLTLSYGVTSNTFDSSTFYSSSSNTNIPIIIADNCQKIYATISLAYLPESTSSGTNGYYLEQGVLSGSNPQTSSGLGLQIIDKVSGMTTFPAEVVSGPFTTNGHFVVGLTYPQGSVTYPGTNVYCDLLIKNIWRSPISIYNTYSSYSVSDMAVKQVVVLFGKTSSGATFLVTNSGTPISSITSYAVTSLSNFIGLMNSVILNYDSTLSFVSFFTDPSVVSSNNELSISNNAVLQTQSLLNGSIINPNTVFNSPNMWYMLLQKSNSANLSVDPTSQIIFNNDGINYFDLQNSSLCCTGKVNYSNSILNILTVNSQFLFANSIYSGEITINGQTFYNLVILPEAQFNGAPTTNTGNLSIYAINNSPFYTSTSSTSQSSTRFDTNATTSKITMTVSNVDIV